jgi:hypothetical protein
MPLPVTMNTIPVTQQAQQAFEAAVTDLTSIVSSVLDSNQQLTSDAMVSDTGRKFGGAVVLWVEKFEDLRRTLQWMAEQLGVQWQTMLQNENKGVEIASGLSTMSMPF